MRPTYESRFREAEAEAEGRAKEAQRHVAALLSRTRPAEPRPDALERIAHALERIAHALERIATAPTDPRPGEGSGLAGF